MAGTVVLALLVMAVNITLVAKFVERSDYGPGVFVVLALIGVLYFGICFALVWTDITSFGKMVMHLVLGDRSRCSIGSENADASTLDAAFLANK